MLRYSKALMIGRTDLATHQETICPESRPSIWQDKYAHTGVYIGLVHKKNK